jgi:hypothetical protein
MMAAGFETTSHAITWCLTMMVSPDTVQMAAFELGGGELSTVGKVAVQVLKSFWVSGLGLAYQSASIDPGSTVG